MARQDDEEVKGMGKDIGPRKPEDYSTFEEYLEADPGTLVSQDLALEGMLIDPEDAPYGFTQYELNAPRYGLSGRYTRTATGRSPFEQQDRLSGDREPEQQQVQPDFIDSGKGIPLRVDDAGADQAEAYLQRQMSTGKGFGQLDPDSFIGDRSAQDYLGGDYMSGLGTFGKAQGLGLGTGIAQAATMGASPGAIAGAMPEAITGMVVNPAMMGAMTGYTANQAFDLAGRGTELGTLASKAEKAGLTGSEFEAATKELGGRRQSMTGLSRLGRSFGLGGLSDDFNITEAGNIASAFASEQELTDPTNELVAEYQAMMTQRAEEEAAFAAKVQAEREATSREGTRSDTGEASPGGRYGVNYGYGFGSRQPSIGRWFMRRALAREGGQRDADTSGGRFGIIEGAEGPWGQDPSIFGLSGFGRERDSRFGYGRFGGGQSDVAGAGGEGDIDAGWT